MNTHSNTTHDGLVMAYCLNSAGESVPLDRDAIQAFEADQNFIRFHPDYTHYRAEAWLEKQPNLGEVVCAALFAEETRPRSVTDTNGLLVVLHGVNLDPGPDPEDTISIRIWTGQDTVITSCKRAILSIDDMRTAILRGKGPESPGRFLVTLTQLLVDRISNVVGDIDAATDELEDLLLTADSDQPRSIPGTVRRQVISLRRYLAHCQHHTCTRTS